MTPTRPCICVSIAQDLPESEEPYHVATTSDHGDNTSVELDEVLDLASCEVDLDSVVDLDRRVGVADPKSIQQIDFETSPRGRSDARHKRLPSCA
jgi:hypothetical protein